jgi:hypothetical protein
MSEQTLPEFPGVSVAQTSDGCTGPLADICGETGLLWYEVSAPLLLCVIKMRHPRVDTTQIREGTSQNL